MYRPNGQVRRMTDKQSALLEDADREAWAKWSVKPPKEDIPAGMPSIPVNPSGTTPSGVLWLPMPQSSSGLACRPRLLRAGTRCRLRLAELFRPELTVGR